MGDRNNFIVLLVISVFLLSLGCASIMHGSKQSISFQSTPTGANVEIRDAMGVAFGSCETPCTLDLKRKREYKVTITKFGYNPVDIVIQKKSDGWIWGNILFGGVIGLIIDFSNGSAYRLSPSEVQATLLQKSMGFNTYSESGHPTIVIIDFDELSPTEKNNISQLDYFNLYEKSIIIE